MKKYCFFLLWAWWAAVPLPAQEHTHADGTTHGDHEQAGSGQEATASKKPDHSTVYGLSDKYELTLYYPDMEAAKEAQMTLYVADAATNHPIADAKLSVTVAGQKTQPVEVQPATPGVYILHTTFISRGTYRLDVQIAHPQGADLIAVEGVEVGKVEQPSGSTAEPYKSTAGALWFAGGLVAGILLTWWITKRRPRALTVFFLLVSAWLSAPSHSRIWAHGDEPHGPKEGGGGYGRTVETPKETQFLFEIYTLPLSVGDYYPSSTLYGTVVPAVNGLGVVTAPQNGRIVRVSAVVGQQVRAGQVLAVLEQTVGTADEVSMTTSNAGMTVQMETAKARVAATQREWERLQKISDIAAGKELQSAEANYRQALAELSTLEKQIARAGSAAGRRSVLLTAPITGVVAPFTLTAGAEVIAGQNLMSITNLNKVYVEAQVYDRDLDMIRHGNKFLVSCSTHDHKTAEVRLLSQAQMMNPGNQSQRVLFEMDNPKGEFKISEFVTIRALHVSGNRQISVPNAALTEINGKTAVFAKIHPETFELHYVQTGADDGQRTVIFKGLEEGEKVVVNGTYEVKMMYLNQ